MQVMDRTIQPIGKRAQGVLDRMIAPAYVGWAAMVTWYDCAPDDEDAPEEPPSPRFNLTINRRTHPCRPHLVSAGAEGPLMLLVVGRHGATGSLELSNANEIEGFGYAAKVHDGWQVGQQLLMDPGAEDPFMVLDSLRSPLQPELAVALAMARMGMFAELLGRLRA